LGRKQSGKLFTVFRIGRIVSMAFMAFDSHGLSLKLIDKRIAKNAQRVKT